MSFTWDKCQDRVWFARWEDARTKLALYAVVESVPGSSDWDWTVWLPDQPKITRGGVAGSALEASVAAGDAAEDCLREAGEAVSRL